ncbi:MAG TPA: hypothetical protein PLX89_20930 [Verrucomicrobiota bacterium]|nr:hypothetical protein [Verrucomicrobiota bacterium]
MELPELNALDARDRLMLALGLGIPSPLRDLPLQSEPMADVDQSSEVRIRRAQAGVRYQLCDEDGNVLADAPQGTVLARTDPGEAGVVLLTPPIREDVTFSILATRVDAAGVVRAAVYLTRTVSVKVGLNTKLAVRFEPALGQIADGLRIVIPFGLKPAGMPVQVNVEGSQEGVSYLLVLKDRPRVSISEVVRGNRGTIPLLTNDGFEEDATIRVKAFRTTSSDISALLDAVVQVDVLPDIRLAVTASPVILDYGARTRLEVAEPQKSADYQLFQQPVLASQYVPVDTAGALVVSTENDKSIGLRITPRSGSGKEWEGFLEAAPMEAKGKAAVAESEILMEDTLFAVRATKKVSQESRFLLTALAVLVRPDPKPAVTVVTSPVQPNAEGFVSVAGGQRGVRYQLRRAADDVDVLLPGYHRDDRGIGSVRVGVDFEVEDAGEERVLLPTGPLSATTEFYVLAEKFRTGLTAELLQRVTIEVVGSPASAPKPPRSRKPKPEPEPEPTPAPEPTPTPAPVLELTPAPLRPQSIRARTVRKTAVKPKPELKSKPADRAKREVKSATAVKPKAVVKPKVPRKPKRPSASTPPAHSSGGAGAQPKPASNSKSATRLKPAAKPKAEGKAAPSPKATLPTTPPGLPQTSQERGNHPAGPLQQAAHRVTSTPHSQITFLRTEVRAPRKSAASAKTGAKPSAKPKSSTGRQPKGKKSPRKSGKS